MSTFKGVMKSMKILSSKPKKPKRQYTMRKPHTNAEIKNILKQIKTEAYKAKPRKSALNRHIKKVLKIKKVR